MTFVNDYAQKVYVSICIGNCVLSPLNRDDTKKCVFLVAKHSERLLTYDNNKIEKSRLFYDLITCFFWRKGIFLLVFII